MSVVNYNFATRLNFPLPQHMKHCKTVFGRVSVNLLFITQGTEGEIWAGVRISNLATLDKSF